MIALRLIAKFLGQDNLLFTLNILGLPLASIENVVDASLLLTGILDAGGLLVLELLVELSDQLNITCSSKHRMISNNIHHSEALPSETIAIPLQQSSQMTYLRQRARGRCWLWKSWRRRVWRPASMAERRKAWGGQPGAEKCGQWSARSAGRHERKHGKTALLR